MRRCDVRLTVRTIAVPAALLASGLAAGPAGAAFPGRNGLIAFDTNDGPSSQIHTIAADGTGLRQLTHGKARRTDPHWSVDGALIAYVSDESGSPQLWAMRRDGSRQHAVTHDSGADYFSPSWSPNGRRLLASRCSHVFGTCDIVTVRARGGGLRTLVGGFWHHGQPAYSPNGRRIAFTSDRGGYDSRLWVAAANGRHRRHITPPALAADRVSWSPSGRRLTFTGDPASGKVFTVAPAGGRIHLPRQPRETLYASYSPDGRKLVANVADSKCDCRVLAIADASGKHYRKLARTRLEGVLFSDWGVAR
jgi:Tol biopolymer transport system component